MRALLASVLFSVSCSLVFGQVVTVSPNPYPSKGQQTVQADFNGDGILDVVSLDVSTVQNAAFYITLSNAAGGYNAPVAYNTPYRQNSAAITFGDFNGDGKVDIAVVDASHNYYIFLNRGDGTFFPSWNFSTPTPAGNLVVATADFNHDGKLDLVLGDDQGNLKLLYGTGHGTFSAPFLIARDFYISNFFIGDYDSDGNADLAVTYPGACPRCLTYFAVYYGDGKGNFSTPTVYSYADDIIFTSANVDGDSFTDLVGAGIAGSTGAAYIRILHGKADRTFAQQDIPLQGFAGGDIVVADFNGDGTRDLALLESFRNDNPVVVIPGNPDGTYQPPQTVYSGNFNGLLVGRYNHDTAPDFLAATLQTDSTATFDFLLNTTNGSFPSCNPPNASAGIAICFPANGSTVSSPVKFGVAASFTSPLRKTEVWIDGKKIKESFNSYETISFLDGSFALAAGSHRADVYSAAYDNRLQHKTIYFTVK